MDTTTDQPIAEVVAYVKRRTRTAIRECRDLFYDEDNGWDADGIAENIAFDLDLDGTPAWLLRIVTRMCGA